METAEEMDIFLDTYEFSKLKEGIRILNKPKKSIKFKIFETYQLTKSQALMVCC